MMASIRTPLSTFLSRTRSPRNRNSCGSLTAWLRPFRNNLPIPTLGMIYIESIDHFLPMSGFGKGGA